MSPASAATPALEPRLAGGAPPLNRNRGFGLLWFGEGVSLLGNATTSILLPLVAVVAFDAGPGWMGLLAAAAWLPWLVIGLPAGAWVDRLPARGVMIVADLVAAASLASVPVGWALGVLTLPQLLAVALLGGACTVFFRTAYVVFLPQVVAPEQLEPANARLFGTESAMQIAGPGVGGVLAQWLSAALGLVVDAASFLVSAVCLWRIKPRYAAVPPEGPRLPLAARIAEGVRFVRSDRYLRWFVAIGGLSNFGLTGYTALLVLFLVRDLGLSPSAVGTVMMAGSSGGLVGATLATRASRRFGSGWASTGLLLLSGPPVMLIGLGERGWRLGLTVAGMFLVGAFVVAGNVVRGSWRQRYVPQALMGRVLTASQVVNFGTMPLAGVTAGWMGEHVGVRATILTMAAVHLLACLSVLRSPFWRLRHLPEPRHA